jgi:hypothetical protein
VFEIKVRIFATDADMGENPLPAIRKKKKNFKIEMQVALISVLAEERKRRVIFASS